MNRTFKIGREGGNLTFMTGKEETLQLSLEGSSYILHFMNLYCDSREGSGLALTAGEDEHLVLVTGGKDALYS